MVALEDEAPTPAARLESRKKKFTVKVPGVGKERGSLKMFKNLWTSFLKGRLSVSTTKPLSQSPFARIVFCHVLPT